jgi:glycosyltransferase involved in cell wall biosynthesis
VTTAPVAAMDALHGALRTHRCVDAFIAPSRFARSRYVRAGWPADRIHVKYNTSPDRGAIREGPGHGFVCLSRLSPEKGVDVLLRGWERAFPDGREQLTIAGGGDLDDELRAAASGVAGVTFAGHIAAEEALDLVAGARALVVPSRWYELFPRTVAEAYSLGVPVIASRLGSLAEVVRDGRTGLLFEPGDERSLAAALVRLADDPELAERLGRRGRRFWERLLSPESTTDALLGLYGAPRRAAAPEPAPA